MTAASQRSGDRRWRVTALFVGAVVLSGVTAAHAQPASASAANGTDSATRSAATVGVSLALASLWDDETHLGRGAAVAGEASIPVGPFVRAGVEGGWFRHTRDSGYLAASGHVLHLMGRADLFLAPRHWRARPFIGAGVGLARSTGTLTFNTIGPGGGSDATTRQPWTHTQAAWNLRLGTRVVAGPRLAIRPEVGAGAIGTSNTAGALELPLLRLHGGVAVEWAPR